jgi:hypothetical protein
MDPVNLNEGNAMPISVKVIRGLFLLDAVLWVALGVVSLVRLSDSTNVPLIVAIGIAVLMFIYAGILMLLRWGLIYKPRLSFYSSVILFAITAVLSITDQVGFWDLVSVALNIFMLVLLLIYRQSFLGVKASPEPS